MGSEAILILVVVVVAVGFDFTNGFHDTADAVATSIATGALKRRYAVAMSAVFNLIGAFVSIKVAATIAKGIVDPHVLLGGDGLELVFAALVGAIIWNLITWYLTMPSSSTHALTGGIIGATLVASGAKAISFHELAQTGLAPAVLSPIICLIVATTGTFGVYKLIHRIGGAGA
jgi:PiT family inorganic phosphate transporter